MGLYAGIQVDMRKAKPSLSSAGSMVGWLAGSFAGSLAGGSAGLRHSAGWNRSFGNGLVQCSGLSGIYHWFQISDQYHFCFPEDLAVSTQKEGISQKN